MKVSMFLAVLLPLLFSFQATAQETVSLEVVKFNWAMYEPGKVINEPSFFEEESTGLANRNKRSGEKTIEEQSRELRRVETAARRSGANPPGAVFLYELKVKNADQRAVKSFVWEYQTPKESASRSDAPRSFLCGEKIKAGDSKTLKMTSRLPPVNVIDASASNDKSKKSFVVEAIINRVEYEDGTIWKRADWDDSRYTFDLPKTDEKLKTGDCKVL